MIDKKKFDSGILIWALDPTQKPQESKKIIQQIRIWSRQLGLSVQPVSIFSKRTMNFPVEYSLPWQDQLKDVALKAVHHFLEKTKTTDFLPAKILYVETDSLSAMVSEMARYAKNVKAEIIFTNTHEKKTWNPLRLGGFVERLITTSSVPVFLINPSMKSLKGTPQALFPTDFSNESHHAFSKFSAWAKAFKTKIYLFSQVETPFVYPSEYFASWQSMNLEPLMVDAEQGRQKKSEAWRHELAEENIKSKIHIQREKMNLTKSILNEARKGPCQLIVLSTHRDRVIPTFLGNVTRDILLQAPCPVLVFHRPEPVHHVIDKKRKHRMNSNLRSKNSFELEKPKEPKPKETLVPTYFEKEVGNFSDLSNQEE